MDIGEDKMISNSGLKIYSKEDADADTPILLNQQNNYEKYKHDLIIELKKSVDYDQEFYVVYQPIYNDKTSRIEAVEALARWKNNKYGEIPPNQFIPLLEEFEWIRKFGFNMIRKILRDIKRLESNLLDITFNINISPKQLEDKYFFDEVYYLIDLSQVKRENIVFEITETQILNVEKTNFDEIIDKKIKISIDDFGIGYSSISNILKLPVSQLKLDRFLIKEIHHEQLPLILVDGILSIARKIGIDVIAEGVETKEQYYILKKIGVEKFQGYLFSRPKKLEHLLIDLQSKHSNIHVSY